MELVSDRHPKTPHRGAKPADDAIFDISNDQPSHATNLLCLIASDKDSSPAFHSSQGFVRVEDVALEIPVRFFFVEGNSF
jgi:hypothetical protein